MIYDYFISQSYFLDESEEAKLKDEINNLLKNLENLLDLNSTEMNQTKIIQTSIICESMIKFHLKKNFYLFKPNTPFEFLIDFAQAGTLIPNETYKFLQIILKYRAKSLEGIETSDKLTSSFLDTFILFIRWFEDIYPKTFKTENCMVKIKSSFDINSEMKFNNIDSAVKTDTINFSACSNCGHALERDDNFCPTCGVKINHKSYMNSANSEMILKQLGKQNESLIQILESVLETNRIVKGIDEKINIITQRLNQIQSQTEKLINNAWSDEEIDRIIQVHTSECIESILEHQNDIINDENYEYVKNSLIKTFGNATWTKLCEKSRTFLITSKLMFTKLLGLDDSIDYSGICILVTKAVEVEIYKRFFTDFISYLDEQYLRDYSQYPTALLFKNTEPLRPEKFTMGNISFVMQPEKNWHDSFKQKQNNKEKLMEYCKAKVFSKYSEDEISEMLDSYAISIEEIKTKYRNPSAHRNQIECVDAKECIDLIIDVEKLLKKMIDSFDR